MTARSVVAEVLVEQRDVTSAPMTDTSPPWNDKREGVLAYQDLKQAITAGLIGAPPGNAIPSANVQPASVDLRLGTVAYRLRCSFLPDREPVKQKLRDYVLDVIDLTSGAILEPNRPYLIPLVEHLDLPDHVRARANPKSSTGRVDIFTRVVSDRGHFFDDISSGYSGPLYLEVVSRSFVVRVASGLTLNQLRLVMGAPSVSDSELLAAHEARPLVVEADRRKIEARRLTIVDGLFLSLDLMGGDNGVVGYRARPNSRLLDLTKVGTHRVSDFWDVIYREEDAPRVVLEPEQFYLLLSAEAVRVPPEWAGEMSAYAETSGELRSHYAGFFDPGFGHFPPGTLRGSRAVLEVRAHDVPFMVEQHQRVCKLTFERMTASPNVLYGQDIESNYQGQQAVLSKYFSRDHSSAGQLSLLSGVR